jgi:hypothetical protein
LDQRINPARLARGIDDCAGIGIAGQQAFAPATVAAADDHRGVEREAAAVPLLQLRTVCALKPAAALERAQDALADGGLDRRDGVGLGAGAGWNRTPSPSVSNKASMAQT